MSIEIAHSEVWVSRNGTKWLVLRNENYRNDNFLAINGNGEQLRFWLSGKVAYRNGNSPEDLVRLSDTQSLEINLPVRVHGALACS